MQQMLDCYGAGIQIDQVQLQKVDPPAQVIDAFRDVQAARADQERLQNEAYAYANRIVPEARGEAERILQGAEGYKRADGRRGQGQTARFLKVYEQYKKAPDVTRKRMFLETMERVLGGTDKIILDSKGGARASCRICRSTSCSPKKRAGSQLMIMRSFLAALVVLLGARRRGCLSSRFHRASERAGARASSSASRSAIITDAGAALENPGRRRPSTISTSASSTSTRRRRRSSPPTRSASSSMPSRATGSSIRCCSIRPCATSAASARGSARSSKSALRRVLGGATFQDVVRDKREELMKRIAKQVNEEGKEFGLEVVDVRIKRADLPEQNSKSDLRPHAGRAPARGGRVPRRGRRPRQPHPRHRRPRGHRHQGRGHARGRAHCAARAMPSATASLPRPSAAIPTSSASTARCRPTRQRMKAGRHAPADLARTGVLPVLQQSDRETDSAWRTTEAMSDLSSASALCSVIEGLLWAPRAASGHAPAGGRRRHTPERYVADSAGCDRRRGWGGNCLAHARLKSCSRLRLAPVGRHRRVCHILR